MITASSSTDFFQDGFEAMDPDELSVLSCVINTSKQRVKKQSSIPACPELQKNFNDKDFAKAQGRPFSADMKIRMVLCESIKQIYSITNDKKPHSCPSSVLQFDDLPNRCDDGGLKRRKLSSNRYKVNGHGDVIYDSAHVTQAIADTFGVTEFSYVQVVRVSSDQDSSHKQLVKNQKVLKLNVIPKPIERFHHTKYIKADVCYPRYKSMMTIYLIPTACLREQHYYTTQLLMDQDERLKGLDQNADYFGPESLGLPPITMKERIKIAEAIKRRHKREHEPDPWYVNDQILTILKHQYESKRLYNSHETAAISVLLNGMVSPSSSSSNHESDDESPPTTTNHNYKRISVQSLLC